MKGPTAKAENTASSREDAVLVAQCQDGQTASYGELVRKYQDRVFNLCLRMCGNRAESEDLTQEAFVRALEAIDRFVGRSGFYTWLFRITVNLVLTARRKKSRTMTFSLDAAVGSGRAGPSSAPAEAQTHAQRLVADADAPDARLLDEERAQLVAQALASIEEEHRCVVILRDMESLGYQEIADILDVPVGTVKSRLHRARLALREKLSPILEDRPRPQSEPT